MGTRGAVLGNNRAAPFCETCKVQVVEDVTPGEADGGNINLTPAKAHGTRKRTKRSLAGNTARAAAATRKKHIYSAYVVMTIEVGVGTGKSDVDGV